MKGGITKAMVLAAGLGTRLRPLTLTVPKPLLCLDSQKLVDYPLSLLAKGGVRKVVINLHHLGDMIREYVGDGRRYGLNVSYSFEPEILGTGGGIKNAESFFGGEPFVCINSDSLIKADIKALIAAHLASNADATMVLKERKPSDPYAGVSVKEGIVKGFGDGDHFYTGLQVIGPRLLKILPPAGRISCLINDGYKKLIAAGGNVAAFIYSGYFSDLGTPERYERAKEDIARGAYRSETL